MGKMLVNCDYCGKQVLKWPKDVRGSAHHFCSKECHYAWFRTQGFKPRNFKNNKVKCEYCGKDFFRSPANIKGHIYCSTKCIQSASHIEFTCPVCNKKVVRRRSKNRHSINFCSKQCSAKWHSGKKNTNHKESEERTCPVCGLVFMVKSCERQKKFCSHECMSKWFSRTRIREGNPYWKEKSGTTCDICGKMFETYPKSKRRFCSWNCWLKYLKTVRKISKGNRMKMLKALIKRPNKPEQKIITIIEEHQLPFKYVGDGKLIIQDLNPDFISDNGKQIIEVFGDYWHNPKVCSERRREKTRRKMFSELGYSTLILWEHEIDDKDEVLKRINEFLVQ